MASLYVSEGFNHVTATSLIVCLIILLFFYCHPHFSFFSSYFFCYPHFFSIRIFLSASAIRRYPVHDLQTPKRRESFPLRRAAGSFGISFCHRIFLFFVKILTFWNWKCLYFSFITSYPSFITLLWQAFCDRWQFSKILISIRFSLLQFCPSVASVVSVMLY